MTQTVLRSIRYTLKIRDAPIGIAHSSDILSSMHPGAGGRAGRRALVHYFVEIMGLYRIETANGSLLYLGLQRAKATITIDPDARQPRPSVEMRLHLRPRSPEKE